MSRLASQAKLGFVPLHPDVLPLIAARLLPPPDSEPFSLLDPCCGKGDALARLAEATNCPHVFGAELDSGRAAEAQARLSNATILGPADFLTCRVKAASVSACLCNPPYDSELGGGARMEFYFLSKVTQALMPQGVLVLVCPSHQLDSWTDTAKVLMQSYRSIVSVPLPREYRNYGEVVTFAVRRPTSKEQSIINCGSFDDPGQLPTYPIPAGTGPKWFEKTEPTAAEIEMLVKLSPLNRIFESPPLPAPRRPPLSLGRNHLALLLAGGMLDGYVASEEPHVVRGVAGKTEYLKEQTETENEKGVTKTTVMSEKITLSIRAAYPDGRIETYA